MDQLSTKLKVSDVNEHLACGLCCAYIIDATTIAECLHTFCRSCIVRYFELSNCCPQCGLMAHKTNPKSSLRADKTLQDIIYKLVPGLYKNEMMRRRTFYSAHEHSNLNNIVRKDNEGRGEIIDRHENSTKESTDVISIALHLSSIMLSDRASVPHNDIRYLLCSAVLTVLQLKMFIRNKFSISSDLQVNIFHTEEFLEDNFSLMDVVCLYSWRRIAPLKLFYVVYDEQTLIRDANVGAPLTSLTRKLSRASLKTSIQSVVWKNSTPFKNKRIHSNLAETSNVAYRSDLSCSSKPSRGPTSGKMFKKKRKICVGENCHTSSILDSESRPNRQSTSVRHSHLSDSKGFSANVLISSNYNENSSHSLDDASSNIENTCDVNHYDLIGSICDTSTVDDAVLRLSSLVSPPAGLNISRVSVGSSEDSNCCPLDLTTPLSSASAFKIKQVNNSSKCSALTNALFDSTNFVAKLSEDRKRTLQQPNPLQRPNPSGLNRNCWRAKPLKIYQDGALDDKLHSQKVGIVISNGRAMTFEEKLSRSHDIQSAVPNRSSLGQIAQKK